MLTKPVWDFLTVFNIDWKGYPKTVDDGVTSSIFKYGSSRAPPVKGIVLSSASISITPHRKRYSTYPTISPINTNVAIRKGFQAPPKKNRIAKRSTGGGMPNGIRESVAGYTKKKIANCGKIPNNIHPAARTIEGAAILFGAECTLAVVAEVVPRNTEHNNRRKTAKVNAEVKIAINAKTGCPAAIQAL